MDLGMTPEFAAYVVSRAAQLIAAGTEPRQAIGEAMMWTLDLMAELAIGDTRRASAFRAELSARIHAEINE